MLGILGGLDLADLLEKRFDNRGAQVEILHILDLPLGPCSVALDALRAVHAGVEADADGEISHERRQQELGLH